ncbi:putative signal transducing protein [Paludibaculum fermentans]|uniref:putative signal transducing protein n=1 Tax=Paludibaculum fermentans TaxID=1473598 RepID=UPI003EB96A0F
MPDEELVVVQSYQWYDEAKLAESVLRAEGVPCELFDEHMLAGRPMHVAASGGMRLMVPASRAKEAMELLEASTLSDEDLAAQAEAAVPSAEDADLLL